MTRLRLIWIDPYCALRKAREKKLEKKALRLLRRYSASKALFRNAGDKDHYDTTRIAYLIQISMCWCTIFLSSLLTLLVLPRLFPTLVFWKYGQQGHGILSVSGYLFVSGVTATLSAAIINIPQIIRLLRSLEARLQRLKAEIQRERRIAKARLDVKRILESLTHEVDVVIDNVEISGGHVDYIVALKEYGIFVLHVKPDTGRITTDENDIYKNGRLFEHKRSILYFLLNEKSIMLHNARVNATNIAHIIKDHTSIQVPVTPVIVFPNAFVANVCCVRGVYVVDIHMLERVLLQSQCKVEREVIEYLGEQKSAVDDFRKNCSGRKLKKIGWLSMLFIPPSCFYCGSTNQASVFNNQRSL